MRKPMTNASQNGGGCTGLDEEVGPLDLFLRRAPRDVVREEVREERLGQVNRQATEEKEAVCVARRRNL